MNVIISKLNEVLYSVLPITAIVVLLNFTLIPIETPLLLRFVLGALLIVIGLTIFLLGVDIGIIPIGNIMGSAIVRPNKILIVVIAGLLLGFFIAIAEPGLHILAGQIDTVTSGLIAKRIIMIVVSFGIAVLFSIGLARIVYNFPLYKTLTILYGIILAIAIFTPPEFIAIAFDASGATTGALMVPFILALARGVSQLKKDSRSSEEDSFGLLAIVCGGPIISVMLMSILTKTDKITGTLPVTESVSTSILAPFIHNLPAVAGEVVIAFAPILITFLIFQKFSFKLGRSALRRLLFGILFTFVGLVFFLLGVNTGFMEVGSIVGYNLAALNNHWYLILVGFIIGMVTILAEPTVNILTHQVEEVTSGYVNRKVVIGALALGVGLALTLSIIRILIPQIQLWHYLLPGYFFAVAMTYYVPKLFVGMAFDSGAVSSGPMTATFILAFTQGVAEAVEGANVFLDGFGVIATVTMVPIIAVQILGSIFKIRSKKGGLNGNEQ